MAEPGDDVKRATGNPAGERPALRDRNDIVVGAVDQQQSRPQGREVAVREVEGRDVAAHRRREIGDQPGHPVGIAVGHQPEDGAPLGAKPGGKRADGGVGVGQPTPGNRFEGGRILRQFQRSRLIRSAGSTVGKSMNHRHV